MIPAANLGSSIVESLPSLSILVAAIAYATRVNTLSRAGRPVPLWRQGFFLAALVVLAVAYLSPLDGLADELLTYHMVQHLLIMDVAALFFVLGLTGPVMQPLLAMRGFRWLRHLASPIIALVIWAALLYVWHIPALYQAATFDSNFVHAIQHLCFITAGIAFWMSLLGPLPKPAWFGGAASAGFVFGLRLIGAVLANILMWSGSVLYPRYTAGEAEHGISGLSDQGTAGVVMMGESTAVTLSLLAWLLLRWARHDTERQELLDLALERGIPLDPERAERAVNAGQGQRLRDRIESGASRADPT
ncbi:MAG: cytochrome c oxidase assembly protein [Solirubrobacterales bacterium]|nr:cytochrome c oxidase assembly protein [Solirubrobacterales bacterium]